MPCFFKKICEKPLSDAGPSLILLILGLPLAAPLETNERLYYQCSYRSGRCSGQADSDTEIDSAIFHPRDLGYAGQQRPVGRVVVDGF